MMQSLAGSLLCVLAAAVGAAGATVGRADVVWRGAVLVRSLRLRGGAPTVLFNAGDSSAEEIGPGLNSKQVARPLKFERCFTR